MISRRRRLFFCLVLILLMLVSCFVLSEVACRIFFRGTVTLGSLIVDDPDLSFRLRSNTSCKSLSPEFRVVYSTDSEHGLRVESKGEKASSSADIIFYGDSFVFGHGVAFPETFPSLIAGSKPGLKIVNAGVFNYGPDQAFLFARRLRKVFEPGLEIACFYPGNDFSDWNRFRMISFESGSLLVSPPVDPSGRMRRKLTSLPGYDMLCRLYLWHTVRRALFERHGDRVGVKEATDDMSGTVGEIARLYSVWKDEAGGDFVVAILPGVGCVVKPDAATDMLVKKLGEYNIPCIDMRREPEFSGRVELFFPVDTHWNAEGHRAAFKVMKRDPRLRPNKDTGSKAE